MWSRLVVFWHNYRRFFFGLLVGWWVFMKIPQIISSDSKPMDNFFLAVANGDLRGVEKHWSTYSHRPYINSFYTIEKFLPDISAEARGKMYLSSTYMGSIGVDSYNNRMMEGIPLRTLGAIDVAAMRYKMEIVKFMASHGFKIQQGIIPLIHHSNQVKNLLPYTERFSILEAVMTGDPDFIRQCLRGTIENYYLYPYPNRALQKKAIEAAVYLNRPDIVLMLHKEAGYRIFGDERATYDGRDTDILVWSIEQNHVELLDIFLRNIKSIHKGILVFARDVASARLLLRYGIKINFPEISNEDIGGFDKNLINATPIVYAVSTENLALVKLYVQNGAEINFSFGDKNQNTPLSWAIKTGQTAIVDYLRSIGAKVKVDGIPPSIIQGRKEKEGFKKHLANPSGPRRGNKLPPIPPPASSSRS